jgi:hypothetical protein
MNRGNCKECKLNENQKQITYLCPDCEHYGICDCSKAELEKEKAGKTNEQKISIIRKIKTRIFTQC